MYKKHKSVIWLVIFAFVAFFGFWYDLKDGWVGGFGIFGVLWQLYHIVP